MRINKSKLDHYVVKRARAKKWLSSDDTGIFLAALHYFRSLNTKADERVYIHVKHLYDEEISKFCFYKELKERGYLIK